MSRITIPDAVREMLAIVKRLEASYPHKKFTLDGRLVGDIGEILAEEAYDLKLFADMTKHHDGTCSDGRLVQVKATMKSQLTFPGDHIPNYYLGIKIHPDGTFTEIFNGPGALAWEAVKGRGPTKNNLHGVGLAALSKLQARVSTSDRIPLRPNKALERSRVG
jgi:hypothetical protein